MPSPVRCPGPRVRSLALVGVVVIALIASCLCNPRHRVAAEPTAVAVAVAVTNNSSNSTRAEGRGGVVGALYLPDHNDEYPEFGGYPDRESLRGAIDLDLQLLSKYFTHIRTPMATYYSIDIAPIAQRHGLKVFLGMPVVAVRSEIRRQIRAIQRAVVQHPETIASIMVGEMDQELNVDALLKQLEELKAALGPHAVKFNIGFVTWCDSEDVAMHMGDLLRAFDVFGCSVERGDGQALEVMLSRPGYDPTKLAFIQTGTTIVPNDMAALAYYEGLMHWRPPWPGAVVMWSEIFDNDKNPGQRHTAGLFTTNRHRKVAGLPRPLDPSDDPIRLPSRPFDETCPLGTYYELYRSFVNSRTTAICMASGVNFRNPTKFNELTLAAACANPWCHEEVKTVEAALREPKCPLDDSMSNATIQSLIIKPFRQNCGAVPQDINTVDINVDRRMTFGLDECIVGVMVNNSTRQELCESVSGYNFESLKPLNQSVLEKMCFQPSCELILFQLVSLRRGYWRRKTVDAFNVLEKTILQPYYDGCYETSLLADDYFDITYRKRKSKPMLPPVVDDKVEPLKNEQDVGRRPNDASNPVGDVGDKSDSSKPISAQGWSTGLTVACIATPTAVVFLLALVFRARRQRQEKSTTDSTGHVSMSDDEDGNRGSNNGLVWRTNDTKPVWADSTLAEMFIDPTTIRDIRLIGSGGQALVYLVTQTLVAGSKASTAAIGQASTLQPSRRRSLAAKRLGTHHATNDPEALGTFIAEIKLVASLQHPQIVSLVGVTWTNGLDIQALFEYMHGGDLCNYLSATKATEQARGWTSTKLQLAIDVIDALAYVHARTPVVVHRDIKSRNVLLTATAEPDVQPARSTHTQSSVIHAKLTDFGVARSKSSRETMTTGVGTSRWLAPEVIVGGGGYDESCDVYSFGVVLSELDTHELPFTDQRTPTGDVLPAIALMEAIAEGRIAPSFGPTCPPSLLALARACLSFNPKLRPSAAIVARELRKFQTEGR